MSAVESYVAALGNALDGPPGSKRDLLREAHDHLTDATESLQATGLTRVAAERRAVAEFGDLGEIAPAYQAVLSSGHSRRIALGLLLVTLAQPLAWGTWNAAAESTTDTPAQAALNAAVHVVGVAAMVVALVVALLGGIGVRRLGVSARVIRAACIATLTLSTAILLMAVAMVLTSSGPSLLGGAYALGVAIVPYALLAGRSTRCLRALGRARDLSRPRVRA